MHRLILGDCREAMASIEDNSVDSIVTDPPYELGFMGKGWDKSGIAYDSMVWEQCIRVLKPGGYLLAFGGSRTYHRLASAIEDAGFEIRDQIMWVYGSGFPKSRSVSKDFDRGNRKIIGTQEAPGIAKSNVAQGAQRRTHTTFPKYDQSPVGEMAKTWNGWGTALKPAHEPICVARKPIFSTVAENVQRFGTGAMNIDGCRVDYNGEQPNLGGRANTKMGGDGYGFKASGRPDAANTKGRWPANLAHDGSDEVTSLFPRVKTQRIEKPSDCSVDGQTSFQSMRGNRPARGYSDDGSAARFFFECKGSIMDSWLDLNLPAESADSADVDSSQKRKSVVSALVRAASVELPEELLCSGLSLEPSTAATGSELKLLVESVTLAIQSIGSRFLLGSEQLRLSLSSGRVRFAAAHEPTGTTTITVSHWKSDGSAAPATFSITPQKLERGERASRFKYCAKASKEDRDEGLEGLPDRVLAMSGGAAAAAARGEEYDNGDSGMNQTKVRKNKHPTVKPTDLMRWLCRLVTPPGGTILDPFTGSGSTGKAAVLEGFGFIGIEKEPEYIEIATARVAAAEKKMKSKLV